MIEDIKIKLSQEVEEERRRRLAEGDESKRSIDERDKLIAQEREKEFLLVTTSNLACVPWAVK